jgi:hypothetical protein
MKRTTAFLNAAVSKITLCFLLSLGTLFVTLFNA